MKKIILASASPRRKELLGKLGIPFQVEASELPESYVNNLTPVEMVRFLSLEKARMVSKKYPDALIIAADTIGVLGRKIIGKPDGAGDAVRMLRELSGRTHRVITGFTIMDGETGKTLTQTVTTEVTFRKLSRREIEAYVRTGEPLDKAGAYAIQGLGAVLVKETKGDYYNVMGLPLSALAAALKRFGVRVLNEYRCGV